MTIQKIQEKIVDEFSMFNEVMDKYEHIIELGNNLPGIDEQYKIKDNLVKGCQSRVWLHAEQKDNNIIFLADSDTLITKGIIAFLTISLHFNSIHFALISCIISTASTS